MLHMVMTFEAKNRSFSILEHNLPYAVARDQAKRERMDGLPAFYLETGVLPHTGPAKDCGKCEDRVRAKLKALDKTTAKAKRGKLDV